jgi:intracellular sulfur oxidation DsrE/DsrF family protein
MTDCLTRIEAEKDLMKTIAETALEKYGVPKATTNKVAAIVHKRNLDEERAKAEDLFDFVDTVVNGGVK